MMKNVLFLISVSLFLIACSDDKESVARPKEICHKETYCAEYGGGFAIHKCVREATRDVCEEIRY